MKNLAKEATKTLKEMNNLAIKKMQEVTNNKERNETIADIKRIGKCLIALNEIITRGGEEQNTSTPKQEK